MRRFLHAKQSVAGGVAAALLLLALFEFVSSTDELEPEPEAEDVRASAGDGPAAVAGIDVEEPAIEKEGIFGRLSAIGQKPGSGYCSSIRSPGTFPRAAETQHVGTMTRARYLPPERCLGVSALPIANKASQGTIQKRGAYDWVRYTGACAYGTVLCVFSFLVL